MIFENIKRARALGFHNNCYDMHIVEKSKQIWFKENDFMFSYEDHGVNRLVFFASAWERVDELIDNIDRGTYFLEFMTKNPSDFIPQKACLRGAMMRMANADCRTVFSSDSVVRQYIDPSVIEQAKLTDSEEIHNLLWSSFSTEISHLLSEDELKEVIKEGSISIHRNVAGEIDALLQAQVMPKKFYINQIVNKADKKIIHAILLGRLSQYVNSGGKYLYAWVENGNEASVKFHKKYGMTHDGMWSMIYKIER